MASRKSHDALPARLPRRFRGADDIARFVRLCLGERALEAPALFVIALDHESQLAGMALNSVRVSHAGLSVSEVLDLADELDGDSLALAEVRVGEPRVPDLAEAHEFLILAEHCLDDGLRLMDCVVTVDHCWWSLRELSDCG